MKSKFETVIYTANGVRLSASEWEGGGAWLHLMFPGATASAVLNRDEAQRLIGALQKAMDEAVAA